MSPVSRRDHNAPKNRKDDVPVHSHKTPLRLFRNTFKSNQAPMTAIMVLVLLGTVAYLAPGRMSGPMMPDDVVARVYGRDVTRRDVQQVLAAMMQRLGNQPNLKSMLPLFEKQALNQAVDRKVYEEMADRRGIVLTDAEVRAALEAYFKQFPPEIFYENGKLRSTSEINMQLAGLRQPTTLKLLEQDLRSDLIIRKLMQSVANGVPVDEAWLTEQNRIQNEKLTFEFAAASPDVATITDPGDGTLDAYLKASGALFQYGPRRVLQYVVLTQASLGDAVKVDDAAVKAAYEAKKAQYTEQDYSHILFRAKSDAEFAEATKKAEELRAKLAKGSDFGQAAQELSEDPGSKPNKGHLGWYKLGTMVKPFEDAALALKPGEISQPVRTAYGVHLIKLEGRKEKSFDEVKGELKTQLLKDRFAILAKEKLERLRKQSNGGDLAKAATTLGLKAQTSLPVLNDGSAALTGVSDATGLAAEAFRMKVGEVSKVDPAGEDFVVFRVQEEKPIAIPPLAEIRAKVLASWKMEQARKAVEAKAKTALQAKDLAQLAAPTTKSDVTIQSLDSLGQHPPVQKALLDTAVDGFTPVLWTPDGQVWIARVKARTPAEPLTFEKRMALVQSIQAETAQDYLQAELKFLDQKGRQHGGFSSFYGHFNGIWVSEQAAATATGVAGTSGEE